MLIFIFIMLAKKNSLCMYTCYSTWTHYTECQTTSSSLMLLRGATNTNSTVFGLTRMWVAPIIYHIRACQPLNYWCCMLCVQVIYHIYKVYNIIIGWLITIITNNYNCITSVQINDSLNYSNSIFDKKKISTKGHNSC